MPKSFVPLVVEPDHPDHGTWTVRVGNNEVLVHSIANKQNAISDAKRLVRKNGSAGGGRFTDPSERPGIIIRNSDGSFQRFVSNDKYWDEWVRPRGGWRD